MKTNKKKLSRCLLGVLTLILVTVIVVFFVKKIPISKLDKGATSTTGQAPLLNEYHINLPNALMLVDAQGRRTGKDPMTGVFYREIPDVSYGEIGSTGELFTSEPPNGEYKLYVLGGKTGEYRLSVNIYNWPTPPVAQRIKGNIESGSMVVYVQNYNRENLANSGFSYRAMYPSTKSITTEPPHNLPPPK